MKRFILLFSLLYTSLSAELLQKVDTTFSQTTQKQLLSTIATQSKPHTSNSYKIFQGWNKLNTPKNGIDVVKSFQDISQIQLVIAYDTLSKSWAKYAPQNAKSTTPTLSLKHLEPGKTFFVLAKQNVQLKVQAISLSESCKKAQETQLYAMLVDSGEDEGFSSVEKDGIALQSRYYNHHIKGLYTDSRVLLFYPKIQVDSKAELRYGPAKPKVMLHYAKEYESKRFFIFNYRDQKCYMGFFPSKKIPPFPVLKEI